MTQVYTHENIHELNVRLSALTTEALIAWAVLTYQHSLTFACSFGAEDVVLLDLLLKANPHASVFLLDTGRLPADTYQVIEQARGHYGREFSVFVPQTLALQRLLSDEGPNLFYRSREARKACCAVRKVEPLSRALTVFAAWLTGLRRQQSITRTLLPLAEIDEGHGGMMKLNPLANWSEEQVWDYIHRFDLPYNALHDQGFPSIGCAPCTRAVAPGEDLRAGRWWWEEPEQKECGLHVKG